MSRPSGVRSIPNIPRTSMGPSGHSRPSMGGGIQRQKPRHLVAVDPDELNKTSSIPIYGDDGM